MGGSIAKQIIEASSEQSEKAFRLIPLTFFEIMTDVRFEHPSNAPPIFVTELGIMTDVSSTQLEKVSLLITVTEFEIATDFNPEQSLKDEMPIAITELGIVIEASSEQP